MTAPLMNDTVESFCATLRSLITDAYDERDRYAHIAATIRINALHYGAIEAEVDKMLSGETNFITWVIDKVEPCRADVPPTLAAALALPEIAALVAFAKEAARKDVGSSNTTQPEWFWRDRLYWLRQQADSILSAMKGGV